ncbi:MAG: hypothetical protein K5931_02830, partial [Lachnospiraceae bacterium]|nr:hypothetical protein [Lachnospiraceae bacterium]
MKKFLKNAISLVLAFGMVFSEPLPAYSAVVVDKGSKGHQGEIIETIEAEELPDLQAQGEELTVSEALSSEPESEEAVEKEPESSEEEAALQPEKTEGSSRAYGYRAGSEEEAKVSKNAEEEESLSEELPAKYDLRDHGLSTSVKDQDPFGTCWSFGTMAASESNSIKNGLVGSDVDFAERHLAYYLFRNYNYLEDGETRQGVDDPLGNTAGDFAVYEYEDKSVYDPGLNTVKAMFYLLGWRGPANEADYPYKNSKEMDTEKLPRDTENIYGKSLVHLQNFGVINPKKQPEEVKKALQKYGVLAMSYYDEDDSYGDKGSYYCTKDVDSNHTVAVIGWDDNYVFGKNKKGEQPKNNGAWIIKNSWGTEEKCLDNGYMYISYENATLLNAVYCNYEKKDNYDNNYFYSGGVNNQSYKKANSFANIYEIKKGNEILKACGIALKDTDVNYELQIYKNPTDATDPESGEKMLSEPLTGKTKFEGYYTVNLNEPLIFAKGDKVAVVFYLSKGDSIKSTEGVGIYVDNSSDVNLAEDTEQYYTKEERCQSLYSSKTKNDKGNYDGEWNDFIDIKPHPDTARIHAYTVNTTWGL